jgi:hypothetical protein
MRTAAPGYLQLGPLLLSLRSAQLPEHVHARRPHCVPASPPPTSRPGVGSSSFQVATLVSCLHQPNLVEERPTLDELLTGLDGQQLRDLLLYLAARDPYAADEIENQIALSQTTSDESKAGVSSTDSPQRRTQVDPHSPFAAKSIPFCTPWLDDSDGYAGGFFADLGEVWIEAGLAADDLTPEERQRWVQTLTRWQAEIGDYGIDDAFDVAQAAILQGWDYQPPSSAS